MAYGTVKVDNITFTNGGIDQTVTVSGIVQSISGNITATGTIQAATIIGTSTVSGATVTGNVGVFTTVTGGYAGFTTVTGTTVTGTTANFATISGTTITGGAVTVASGTFSGNSTAAAFIPTGSTVPTNGLYSPAANSVALSTSGTGKLFIDSAGKVTVKGAGTAAFVVEGTAPDNSLFIEGSTGHVGIGITNPGSELEVNGTAEALTLQGFDCAQGTNSLALRALGSGANGGFLQNNYTEISFNNRRTSDGNVGTVARIRSIAESDQTSSWPTSLGFYVRRFSSDFQSFRLESTGAAVFQGPSSEFARIDSSGRLLVGTSSVINVPDGETGTRRSPGFQLAGNTFANTTNSIAFYNSTSAGAGCLSFTRSNSSTVGTHLIAANGNRIGKVGFAASDGTDYVEAATITAHVDGTPAGPTPGPASMPGRLVFSTTADGASSPTERMTIKSDGKVGIGTTSPDTYGGKVVIVDGAIGGETTLVVANNSQDQFVRLGINNNDAQIAWDNADSLVFGTASTSATAGLTNEYARIDSSGRLLVGTSSARSTIDVNTTNATPSLQLEGTNSSTAHAALTRAAANEFGAYFSLAKTRGATIGSSDPVVSNDSLGAVRWLGDDGTDFEIAAQIEAFVDGTPGANDMPGRLVFSTTADGASSPTPRMTITSGGAVLIGKPALSATTAGVEFEAAGFIRCVRDGNIAAAFQRYTSDGDVVLFRRDNATVGSISVTTTATAYNTSSDYRLKENIAPVTDGITRLQQLKPSRFNFIADPTKTVDGFLAHEVQTIVPEAITGEKDAVDDEGNPLYQGIDQSKLVPLLTAALQEAIGEIESLKARLTAAGI